MNRIIFLLLGVLVFSCSKKEIVENPEQTTFSFPLKVGSYWVYENFTVDENKVETTTGIIDSVHIIGDTIIDGLEYAIFEGAFKGQGFQSFKRDSSGFIINSNGVIEFSYLNFTDVLSEGNDGGYNYTSKMHKGLAITVPAGYFSIIDRQTVFTLPNNDPINSCGDLSYTMHSSYSSNVGLVFSTCPTYLEMTQCKDHTRRLTSYYIP